MITISENITINSDINTIWAFITNFSMSLNYNRFHTNLELPSNYSVGKMKNFIINLDNHSEFSKMDVKSALMENGMSFLKLIIRIKNKIMPILFWYTNLSIDSFFCYINSSEHV